MKNQSKRLFMECLNCISYWHIHMLIIVILSVSHVLRFATPWTAACQVYLSSTISWSLLRLMSVDLVMQSNQLILCHPLLLLAVYPSIRGFSNELALCIRWLKYWSFSNSPSNEYSELISFRIDCFDLLAVQGALESLLHHHILKAPILWCSAYGPTLTSIHDYWKNHSFDYVDLYWQSDVSAF